MRLLASTLVFCVLIAVGSAAAGAPNPANRARLDSTIRYLQEAQNHDGGFGGASGRESGQGFSAWVALALAAAGVNPRCQARPGGVDAYSFLVDHFHKGLEEEIPYPSIPTTAFERELMVVDASGTDPHSFAGYDLVKEILVRALPDGSFPYVPEGRGEINDTIFAIVALDPIQEPEAQAAIQRAADWLIAQQDDDGGWSFEVKGRRTEADMTGAAIQALRAAGRPDTEAERDGLQYLRAMQSSDSGFPEFPGEAESNVASTAWAVQGIWSAGQDPETWVKGGNDPLSYMASLQQPDGHIRWKASEDTNGVWMTAYVAPAFAGQAWPIPASPCDAKQQAAPTQSGQGEGSQPGGGVIVGGGGRGAPLFSRPKPQSQGRTPGATRQVRRNRYATDHSETKRGENAEQPAITATSEARRKRDEAPAEARENDGGEGAGSSSTGGGGQQSSGREVTGTLVGGGAPGFGAPGLHGAGAGGSGTSGLAMAIGAAALLFGLGGFQLERWRGVALP
ncbi:MAG TPA: prenyltransferase/squalene oxidase repeat-containing protein [Solirubrobacterales bacterium]|nr:prenyltransferase/squalene oxidase repeat-containing protein [Solirubrobacterales bacterium]